MRYEFANVFVFIVVGCAFILVNNVISKLARPDVFSSEKYIPYECGADPVGDARLKFNIRFYTTALIFLLFDVEIAFLFSQDFVQRLVDECERVPHGDSLTRRVQPLRVAGVDGHARPDNGLGQVHGGDVRLLEMNQRLAKLIKELVGKLPARC